MMVVLNIICILIIYFLFRRIQTLQNNYNSLLELYKQEKQSNNIYKEIRDEEQLNKSRIKNSEVKLNYDLDLLVDDKLDISNCGYVYIYSVEDSKEIKNFNKYSYIARIETCNRIFKQNCIAIERLGVGEKYRHKYVGTFLVNRVIEWAKIRSLNSIYLNACGYDDKKGGKTLKEFYRKFGFIDIDGGRYNMVLHLR